ncbi:MAG: amidohydrolase family protein [Thermoanaerobaculia bacterium]|nr:amidohydrolase family protein [Thermoanaerobaculia bacterium]
MPTRFARLPCVALLFLLAIACAADPPVPPAAAPEEAPTLAIHCGRLLDGLADEPLVDATVLVAGERIAAVGTDVEVPPGTPELDLAGHTCLPGLIDMHTHLADKDDSTGDLTAVYRRTEEELIEIGRENAWKTLAAGFTTVRDVGTYQAFADAALRDAIERGDFPGPRMQVAGFYLTVPGGGGDLLIPGVPEEEIPPRVRRGVARGPEEFRAKAEAAVEGGADLLKVIASGAVLAYGGIPGEPEMTPAEIAAVVEVARRHGLRVAAHAHGARSIKEAILAGADTIEHASLADEEALLLAKEHGVALAMDVYNGDWIDSEGRRQGWPEEFLRKNLETVHAQREAFARAYELDVPLVYATDSAVYPHGDNGKQFRIMVELGMAPADAIRSATSVAGRYMGWEDRVGALQPGLYADLVAVEGDPLDDISLLERPDVVVKGGKTIVD